MSCGEPHETDCSEVLAEVWLYLDRECAGERRELLQHHLDECGPCLQKYDLERTVKALVQRSCSEHAPETLRDKVLLRIRQVQVEIHDTRVD